MSSEDEKIHHQEQNPERNELRDAYRLQLADILKRIKNYNGTETEYTDIMERLSTLEQWQTENFGKDGSLRLSTAEEQQIIDTFHKKGADRTISGLLSLMGKRFQKILDAIDNNVKTVYVNNIFLPPGELTNKASGKESEKESGFNKELRPHYNNLRVLLHNNGVFQEDIIRYIGTVDPKMMRKEPYVLVEIPRLNRQVLVCDQYGEATFVIEGRISPELLLSPNMDKKALQTKYAGMIHKIEDHGTPKWEEDMAQVLFNGGVGKKIDVENLSNLRQIVQQKYPTPRDWNSMSRAEKKQKIGPLTLYSLGKKFGIDERVEKNNKQFWELGRRIYGNSPEFDEHETTKQEAIDKIKAKYPTAASWKSIASHNRGEISIEIKTIGTLIEPVMLKRIATLLGVMEGEPSTQNDAYYAMGKIIYDNDPIFDVKEKSREEIIEEIQKLYPTAADWAKLSSEQMEGLKIFSTYGKKRIASILGYTKGVDNKREAYELGRIIYGNDEALALPEEKTHTIEEYKDEIRRQYPTAQDWKEASGKKRQMQFLGQKLTAIATIFGITGNVLSNSEAYFNLGMKIYAKTDIQNLEAESPEQNIFAFKGKSKLTKEKVIEEIKSRYPNPLTLLRTPKEDISALSIEGNGITALATRLGIDLKIARSGKLKEALINSIFGEGSWIEAHEEEKKEIIAAVKAVLPTPADWVKKIGERRDMHFLNLGLIAIASRFNIEGNPYTNTKDYYEVGKAIYGNDLLFHSS